MRIPKSPPSLDKLMSDALAASDPVALLSLLESIPPDRRYLHWDKLLRLPAPDGLTYAQWWLGLKFSRRAQARYLPLMGKDGRPFSCALPDPIPEQLNDIDLRAGGTIGMPEPITNPNMKDRYLVNSLIEEAITSSQLEGAATTRQVAKEMIRTSRPPRDRSERMILNNYFAMQEIGKLRTDPITPEFVLHLHRTVTRDTLDKSGDEGRFRRSDEQIDVGDDYGRVFHQPPPADQLQKRMAAMCDFANGKTPENFVHPVLRSIILHFWLAYDHPFVDGNGRTARALFYWSMLHYGYWICEFISISEIIRKAPAKYGTAFLYTETDDNDLTYFILYHLDVIRRAIDQLHEYVKRKTNEMKMLEQQMRVLSLLNHRQQALISHALRNPRHAYTIDSHSLSHKVVYQTARSDLLDLAKRGVLQAKKVGKQWRFTPSPDIEERLRSSD